MRITRRQFLKAATVASVASPGINGLEGADKPARTDGLPRRILGKTNESVTILGVGGAWITHDRTVRSRKGSEAHTRSIIDAALEGGIRYFDTAPNYYLSEERLGQALAPVRDQVFLVTKLDHVDAKTAEEDLTNSLKLLRTDHVDLLMLHGIGLVSFMDMAAVQRKDGAMTFLRKAKEKGLTRFIGFSSHPLQMEKQRQFALDNGMDVIQPFINYISRAENNTEQDLVEFARTHNIGVTAMKVLGGDGQLADDYDRAFRYVLSVPGVHCALVGMASVAEVKRAVQAARDFRPLTDTEMQETIALGRKLFELKSKKAALLRRHHPQDFCAYA